MWAASRLFTSKLILMTRSKISLKHIGTPIASGMRLKRVNEGNSREPCSDAWKAIKFHPYYFVLGFTIPMLYSFHEVLCSMKCAYVQCSPNAVRVIVGLLNLS